MMKTYIVTGMTCNGCRGSVEKHLNALAEVVSASVNLEKGEATIETNSAIAIQDLKNQLPEKFTISEKQSIKDLKAVAVKASKTELQQLKPLFLIFAYITTAAVIMHYKSWDWSGFMLDFMGLFYIVFSFFKILDLKGFPESFKMYDPLAKAVPAYAKVYPFLELALGVLFLMRIQIALALIITIVILGITTIGVTKTLLNKKSIQCACLGTALKLPMTKATFIENTIMIVMAILMLIKTLG